eukprot:maker-scaffold_7-snap-gene-4.7-mRNA-1 protein AED:0.01 eAED:0.01 QI:146/1/1/1/1/1/2/236/655
MQKTLVFDSPALQDPESIVVSNDFSPLVPAPATALTEEKMKSKVQDSSTETSLVQKADATTRPVEVFLRIKPILNENEKEANLVSLSNTVLETSQGLTRQKFAFTRIFERNSSQEDIFHTCAEDLINKLFKGLSSLIFAYGVTNAGKTYTVEGTQDQPGIIPRTLDQIFQQTKHDDGFSLKVSYIQVYNETVHDLQALKRTKTAQDYLEAKRNIKVKRNKIEVENLIYTPIDCPEKAKTLLQRLNKLRTTHGTKLNANSSRSHSIFGIHLFKNDEKFSSIFIVDLAGTERAKRARNTRKRQQEASAINKSLMNLMNCITDIRHNQKPGAKKKLIPFRSSKLTLLFRDIFLSKHVGGVSMIVNCSSTEDDYNETLNSLKYGAIAQQVRITCKEPLTTRAPTKKIKHTAAKKITDTPSQKVQISKLHEDEVDLLYFDPYSTDDVQYLQGLILDYKEYVHALEKRQTQLLEDQKQSFREKYNALERKKDKNILAHTEHQRKLLKFFKEASEGRKKCEALLRENNIPIPDDETLSESADEENICPNKRKSEVTIDEDRFSRRKTVAQTPVGLKESERFHSEYSRTPVDLSVLKISKGKDCDVESVLTTSSMRSLKKVGGMMKRLLGIRGGNKAKNKTVQEIIHESPVAGRTRNRRKVKL